MIGIVVVSHGNLAQELLRSAAMIVGENVMENTWAVGLDPHEGIDGLTARLKDILSSFHGEGVLILADVYGGSPFNAGTALSLESGERQAIEVVAGVNLPMLMEVLLQRSDLSLPDLVACAYRAGVKGVVVLRDRANLLDSA